MASLNKVMIIGNVGRDPEMRYTANGTAQTSFSVAANRNWKDASGEWREDTEWFNIVAWRDLAERLAQSVTKGKQIYVEGRLQTRSWDDDQGMKHYRTEVIALDVKLLGPRDPGPDGATGTPAPARGAASAGDVDADDLPFE
ncbi:MAG: single-stranded DNA-binding protein [Dehalococcoidia bacterium]